jgi:tetratricopeptide (TPR) repeat protein
VAKKRCSPARNQKRVPQSAQVRGWSELVINRERVAATVAQSVRIGYTGTMRLATAAVALMMLGSAAPAAAGVTWQDGPLAAALQRAQREGKLVFIDVLATWCGPCQEMDAEVYPKEEIGRAMAASFVALRFDGERGEGLEVAQRYHVVGFPTMLIVDGSGAEIDRMMGGLSAPELLQQLERLRQKKGTLADLERTLARAPTEALRLEVATRHALRGEARCVGELEAVAAADPDNRAHRAAAALLTLGKLHYLRGAKDYARADQTLAELERRFPSSEEAGQAPYQRAVAQQRGGHPDQARATLDAWIARAPKDAERLAAYAWFCFKEGGDRPRGIEIARKGLSLAPTDDGLWDTLGELCLASGDRAEARRAFIRAAELAPKKAYYRAQLAKVGGAP